MEDKRLERLYDYTKFHIGLYMTLGAGLVALIAAAADDKSVLRGLVVHPRLLGAAVILMTIAGLAGGIIASSLTQCESFCRFWTEKQGPWSWPLLPGKYWTWVEHTAFWAALLLAASSLLGGKVVTLLSS
jgi:hypothetical protein